MKMPKEEVNVARMKVTMMKGNLLCYDSFGIEVFGNNWW